MKKLFIILLVCNLIAQQAQAQFKPGDIGYSITMQQPYAKMHVLTQLQTIVDEFSYSTPYAQSTFTEKGWLSETIYIQDSSLSDDERSPELKDIYYYHTDGRIRSVELSGYDLYAIQYGFEYDKKEKLIASVIASAEAREYTYVYDKAGNIIKRNGKAARWVYADENDTEGKLEMVAIETNDYTWDKKGNLLTDTYNYSGEWTNSLHYSYNDKQQLILAEMYYDNTVDAKPAFSIEYSYDANGLLTSTVTKEEGFLLTNLFTYTYK